MKVWQGMILSTLFVAHLGQAVGAQKTVEIYHLTENANHKGIGEKAGTVTLEDSDKGLVIRTDLKGLTEGMHGFHVHENPSCEGLEKEGKWIAGEKAGAHFDPEHTKKHLGPDLPGHLGDLPVLVVDKNGVSQSTMVAPRLKVSEITDRSLIIHAGGDNYSDEPKPLGGGGPRVACGVIR